MVNVSAYEPLCDSRECILTAPGIVAARHLQTFRQSGRMSVWGVLFVQIQAEQ